MFVPGLTTKIDQLFYRHALLYHPHSFPSPFRIPACPKYLLSNLSHVSSRQHFQVREGGHRLPELAGISFHPTLIQGCFPLWCHSGSKTAVGHRLQSPGWEGLDHMTALHLWKCRAGERCLGIGRNKWNVTGKNVRLTGQLIFYKGTCIYCTN